MNMLPRIIKAMIAAGATPEVIGAVTEVFEEQAAKARAATAERVRNHRAMKRNVTVTAALQSVTPLPPAPPKDNQNPPLPPTPVPPPPLPLVGVGTLKPKPEPKNRRIEPREEADEDDWEAGLKIGLTPNEIGIEWPKFQDFHRSKGSLMSDWRAAWRTWCRNALKFNEKTGARHVNGSSHLATRPREDALFAAARRIIDRLPDDGPGQLPLGDEDRRHGQGIPAGMGSRDREKPR